MVAGINKTEVAGTGAELLGAKRGHGMPVAAGSVAQAETAGHRIRRA